MDIQEKIGTHEDTPGRTRNLLRTDIIYCKYCNKQERLSESFFVLSLATPWPVEKDAKADHEAKPMHLHEKMLENVTAGICFAVIVDKIGGAPQLNVKN